MYQLAPSYHQPRTESVKIIEVVLNEMVEYGTMGFRPYTATPNTENAVLAAIDYSSKQNNKLTHFNPATIHPLSHSLLGVSGSPTGAIFIDNGWGIKRFSFLMKVEITLSSGGAFCYIVTGFTDTNEAMVNMSNVLISPDITFHITNIVTALMGQNGYLGVNNSEQILTRTQYMNDPAAQGNEFRSQRPKDIMNTLNSNMFRQANSTGMFIDTTTALIEPQMAKRINNLPSVYTSSLLNSYTEAIESNEGYDPGVYFPQPSELCATKSASENGLLENKFIAALNSNNHDSFGVQASFKWKDLLNIDPTVLSRTQINFANTRPGILPSTALVTENPINRTDLIGQTVTVLASSIPALLNQCGLISATFVANNNTGQHQVYVQSAQAFNQQTLVASTQKFEKLLKDYLLDGTFNFLGSFYEIFVFCHSFNETMIKITMDGQGPFDFLMPTFADALSSALVTNNAATIDGISATLNHVSSEILEHKYQQNSNISVAMPANTTGNVGGNNSGNTRVF